MQRWIHFVDGLILVIIVFGIGIAGATGAVDFDIGSRVPFFFISLIVASAIFLTSIPRVLPR